MARPHTRSGQICRESRSITNTEPAAIPSRDAATTLTDLPPTGHNRADTHAVATVSSCYSVLRREGCWLVRGGGLALLLMINACTGSSQPSGSSSAPKVSYNASPIAGCRHGAGRPGQDKALVPAEPTTVRVCSARSSVPGHGGPVHTVNTITGTALRRLVGVLNAGKLGPTKVTTCDGGGVARTYTLDFAYRRGPDVAIDVGPDCHPSVSNGSIASDNTHEVMVVIDNLIGVTCSNLVC